MDGHVGGADSGLVVELESMVELAKAERLAHISIIENEHLGGKKLSSN